MRYKGGNKKRRQCKLKQNFINLQNSDYRLKLVYMKSESLVLLNHHVTVNDLSNFAHTAHHARRVVSAGHFSLSFGSFSGSLRRVSILYLEAHSKGETAQELILSLSRRLKRFCFLRVKEGVAI